MEIMTGIKFDKIAFKLYDGMTAHGNLSAAENYY